MLSKSPGRRDFPCSGGCVLFQWKAGGRVGRQETLNYISQRHVESTSRGDAFYSRKHFQYQRGSDTYVCPARKTLTRERIRPKELDIVYRASADDRSACHLKPHCTRASVGIYTKKRWFECRRTLHPLQ
jgi:hypothetical protein